jgi:hypothetical protein
MTRVSYNPGKDFLHTYGNGLEIGGIGGEVLSLVKNRNTSRNSRDRKQSSSAAQHHGSSDHLDVGERRKKNTHAI